MSFFEWVDRAQQLLARHGGVSQRGLGRELGIDGTDLADVIDELVVREAAVVHGDVLRAGPATIKPLSATMAAPSETTRAQGPGEIRHLTVVFCDTVGSTELSERLGTEEWSEAMHAFLGMVTSVIERWGGRIGNYMGDGLVAYFGYPIALEDGAERAVRSGLEALERLTELNDDLADRFGCELQLRMGIHTGPVVVDQMGDTVQALGKTANLAARIESVAPANSIVMSPETRRLVAGVFVTEDLGNITLKGFTTPISLSRALSVGGVAPRLGAGRSSATALVGRDRELAQLHEIWAKAAAGQGSVVEITGEAGIGKSRLVDAFRESIAEQPHSWLDAYCSPFAQSAPLLPIADVQARALGFRSGASPLEMRADIEGSLTALGLDVERGLDLIGELHGVGVVESDRSSARTALRRFELFDFLEDWIAAFAGLQPTVFVLDDLHWADPTTIDFVERLTQRVPNEPMVLILTSRPEGRPEFESDSVTTTIKIDRLEAAHAARIVRSIAGEHLDQQVVRSIVERADGVALFVEELAMAAVPNPDGYEIPVSIQNLLMARLEVLGGVRTVAQTASIIGREFTLHELSLLSRLSSGELDQLVASAVEHEVFFERSTTSGSGRSYYFKHALMRDAVYESMLRRTRQDLHAQYARVLTTEMPQVVDRRPDLIAAHLHQSGRDIEASRWWQRAAEHALRSASALEAEQFYRRALESAGDDDRARLIELNIALAGSMNSVRGLGHPEVEPIWHAITELAVGDDFTWHQATAQVALAIGVGQRDFGAARAASLAALEIAEPAGLIDVQLCLAALELMMRYYEGRPADCFILIDEIARAGWSSNDAFDRAVGLATEPMAEAWEAAVDSISGRFGSAAAIHRRAAERQSVVAPATETLMITIGASLHLMRGDVATFAEWSDIYVEKARRYDLGYSILLGELLAVASHLILEPNAEELERLDALMGRLSGGGTTLAVPIFLWIIARAQRACGQLERADETAAFGQMIAEATGQRWVDGHLAGFRLVVAAELDRLEPEWFETSREVLEFLTDRGLHAGRLYLAIARFELAGQGGIPDQARHELRRAINAIAEPDGAPIVAYAESLL